MLEGEPSLLFHGAFSWEGMIPPALLTENVGELKFLWQCACNQWITLI